jgi:diguanylate cyclase (GGDEF)-like protein/PAS domain S-box-containing protein
MPSISSDTILESLFDGVYFVDVNRRITYWNKAAERITGYERTSVVGTYCADNLLRHIDANDRKLCLDGCPLSATLTDGKSREATVLLHHRLGHRVPVSIRTSPVRGESGIIVGAVEIFSDNSSKLQILHEYEQLKHDAYLDPLTDLGNRRYAEMSLTTSIYQWQTHSIPFGVMFVDIDHFKHFNDTYGHRTGDEVLVMVAKSISLSLRTIDIAARWGGDEFLLILPGITHEIAHIISERIRMLIENSIILAGNNKLSVTVSIGTTMSQTDDTSDTIVNRADQLMYLSKLGGRNRVTRDDQLPLK